MDATVPTLRRSVPGLKIVTQTRSGKGNALACGFAAATGEIIVTMDADGTADPAEIPALVAALVDGADLATGSRFTGTRRPGTRRRAVLHAVARRWFGAEQSDLGFPFHAFWTDLLPILDLPSIAAPAGDEVWGDGPEIDTLLSCRVAAAGGRLAEIASVPRAARPRPRLADDRRVLQVLLTERRWGRRRGGNAAAPPVSA